jgi:hypothetical protein
MGCSDPGEPAPGSSRRREILDPWKKAVKGGGEYAYLPQTKRFIRIRPCHGDRRQILQLAKERLIQRPVRPLLRLVINVDADTTASGLQTASGLRAQDVEQFLRNNVSAQVICNAVGDIELDGGQTVVSLVRWEVNDPADVGLPDQQTLERLSGAAIGGAYPARRSAVASWLSTRPAPPLGSPKDHAWSYMAGWYAERACENFYSSLWDDPAIAQELKARLQVSGAWRIAIALTN